MKLGIFADSHYSSAEVTCKKRYNSASLGKIKKAFEHFQEEKCDLVICLGDLIDKEEVHQKEIENLKKIRDVMDEFDMPSFVVMGNHDGFAFDEQEFYEILGEKHKPECISEVGKNLIFIDACYFKNGNHYKAGDSDWTDTFFPYVDELEKQIENVSGEVFLFMHQNIDPDISEEHRLFNDAEIRSVLEKSNKVKTVFQGHYHPGKQSAYNGIQYVTFPAMCQNDDAHFVVEI